MSSALQFHGVAKRYAGRPVLDGVDLEVARGECVALAGVNGAGKTTLLRCLLGFARPDAGSIRIMGADHRHPGARAPLAFLPERFLPPAYLTGRDYLRYMLRLAGAPCEAARMAALAEALGMEGAALDRPSRTLSRGTAQKLGLAACLLADKPLLVLDEPMGGLDPKARAQVKDQLRAARARGATVLLTSHELADVDTLCDRIAILHGARLAFTGTPANCRARYDVESLEHAFLRCIE